MDAVTQLFLSKALDIILGLLTLWSIHSKWRSPNMQMFEDILQELEQKTKEAERLQIEIDTWKNHHARLSQREKSN